MKFLTLFFGIILMTVGCARITPVSVDAYAKLPPESLPVRAELVVQSIPIELASVLFKLGVAQPRLISLSQGKTVLKRVFQTIDAPDFARKPHIIIQANQRFESVLDSLTERSARPTTVGFDVYFGDCERLIQYNLTSEFDGFEIESAEDYRMLMEQIYYALAVRLSAEPRLVGGKTAPLESRARLSDRWALDSKLDTHAGAIVRVIAKQVYDGTSPLLGLAQVLSSTRGTGFFIGPGIILTNARMLRERQDITVTTVAGVQKKAKIVVVDEWMDLAVLEIDFPESGWLPLDMTFKAYQEGDEVVLLKAPGARTSTLTASSPPLIEECGNPIDDTENLLTQATMGAVGLVQGVDGRPMMTIQPGVTIHPMDPAEVPSEIKSIRELEVNATMFFDQGGPVIHLSTGKVIGMGSSQEGVIYTLDYISKFFERNAQYLGGGSAR